MDEAIQIAPLNKLAAATRETHIIDKSRCVRAIAIVFLTASNQLAADRARRVVQKMPNRSQRPMPYALRAMSVALGT